MQGAHVQRNRTTYHGMQLACRRAENAQETMTSTAVDVKTVGFFHFIYSPINFNVRFFKAGKAT